MWLSKLKAYQLPPRLADWILTIYSIMIGLVIGYFACQRACADSLVFSFGPTLNGNTNPKMAGVGYEYTWANASLLGECRGIFSSPINGACGLTLSARVETPAGMFVRVGAGPAYYFRMDDRVSSNWNFNLQGVVGLTQNGWAIGAGYFHYSNAGLVPPNNGRDYIGPVLEIGL